MSVVVGRHINGITLNGLEYVLDDEDHVRYFDSVDEAKSFLLQNGVPEEHLEFMVFLESRGKCFRCGHPLFPSELKDYVCQCFHCDEDFYGIEQEDWKDE